MANNGVPAGIPASADIAIDVAGGKGLPPSGKSSQPPISAANRECAFGHRAVDPIHPAGNRRPQTGFAVQQLAQLNKYLQRFRTAEPVSCRSHRRDQTIQEIQPGHRRGQYGELPARQFPALARSLGVSGILVDSHA